MVSEPTRPKIELCLYLRLSMTTEVALARLLLSGRRPEFERFCPEEGDTRSLILLIGRLEVMSPVSCMKPKVRSGVRPAGGLDKIGVLLLGHVRSELVTPHSV